MAATEGARHKSGRHAAPCGLGKLKHAPPMARTSLVGHALACPFSSRTAPLSPAYGLRSETGHLPRKRENPPLLCRTPRYGYNGHRDGNTRGLQPDTGEGCHFLGAHGFRTEFPRATRCGAAVLAGRNGFHRGRTVSPEKMAT